MHEKAEKWNSRLLHAEMQMKQKQEQKDDASFSDEELFIEQEEQKLEAQELSLQVTEVPCMSPVPNVIGNAEEANTRFQQAF